MRLPLRAGLCALVLVVIAGLLKQAGLTSHHPTPPHPTTLSLPPSIVRACAPSSSLIQVSLIAVSSNRTASLRRVLPSWVALQGVDELLLLDWASHPPLHTSLNPPKDRRLRLVSAPFETEWNLARAYNLAIQLARGELLLKLDADTAVQPEFLLHHRLTRREFGRGCRHHTTDENARHLNGVVLAWREQLLQVAGYDERMQYYG